jgi:hypothetical protein
MVSTKKYINILICYLESITQALQGLTLEWISECECLEHCFLHFDWC